MGREHRNTAWNSRFSASTDAVSLLYGGLVAWPEFSSATAPSTAQSFALGFAL